MKQKLIWIAALFSLVTMKGFSQGTTSLPLYAYEGISEITIAENIDVMLIQAGPDNLSVKVPNNTFGKLIISIDHGSLSLAPAKNVKEGERLSVYVWVSDLEKLVLKGSAFATSSGVLHNKNLMISADKESKVLIKSDGKVWFDAPGNYHIVEGKGYSYIQLL